MSREELADRLMNIWEDSEENKRETWIKVADYVLDNYVSKEVLKEFVSHDKLREWLDVCMPLQDMDKRVALFKYEISRLKEFERDVKKELGL